MKIVLFAGYKDGGKTYAIDKIARELVVKGNRVCIVKHIHGGSFTLGKRGKDTWKHVRTGASSVVAVSSDGMFIAKRIRTGMSPFETLENYLAQETPDYVLVEGFNREFAEKQVATVICTAKMKDVESLVSIHLGALFICGRCAANTSYSTYSGIPVLNLRKDIDCAVNLIEGRDLRLPEP